MSLSDPWTGPERLSRCYACCQENCAYGPCSCDCHNPVALLPPMKCKKHPKYEGKRKPRAACEDCYYIWEKNQR